DGLPHQDRPDPAAGGLRVRRTPRSRRNHRRRGRQGDSGGERMSDTDTGERTEKTTDKKLKEARKKGKIGRSQDFTAWICIAAAAIMMPPTIDSAMHVLTELFLSIGGVAENPTKAAALESLGGALGSIGGILMPMMLV